MSMVMFKIFSIRKKIKSCEGETLRPLLFVRLRSRSRSSFLCLFLLLLF
jgi:hypothetical protein